VRIQVPLSSCRGDSSHSHERKGPGSVGGQKYFRASSAKQRAERQLAEQKSGDIS
jgi:hypothetical protein